MNEVIKPDEAFTKLTPWVKSYADPADRPAQFVRDVHRVWKSGGGKLGGKPRHSARYLEEQLKAQDTPVKSLTPKLVGKTNISPQDGAVLIRFFLSHWPEATAGEEIEYKSILSHAEIDFMAKYIETQLTEHMSTKQVAAIEPAPSANVAEMLPGEPTGDVIVRLFQESAALITVSPEHVFVSPSRGMVLTSFRNLMDRLRKTETQERKRPLIWVLDLGGPNMDDLATTRKYLNVQQLITSFKALAHYKDREADDRLEWLKSRAAVVLLDTYGDWKESEISGRRPNFAAHHATLGLIDPEWVTNSNFRALYGSNLERVMQMVFTVFLNASGSWPSAPGLDSQLRYFGYATFEKRTTDNKPTGEYVGRGLELPPLAARFSEAFKTIYAAAAHMLRLKVPASLDIEGKEAIEQLTYLGFRVLLMDEFLEMY